MKTSDRLARLAAPLERQPWQGLMLLAAALPQMAERLAQDRNATFSLDSGG